MLNIVLFGPPGAGKGTQSKLLIEKYGLIHLSTGDLLRDEIARSTELGKRAKAIMDKGDLVSDEIVIGMIESKLSANSKANGFIFDGFPRTNAQAQALDNLLTTHNTSISLMLALEVNNAELTKRLLERGKESGRPDDQNEDIIRNRINEYNNKTAPIKQHYSQQKKYNSVYGMGSIDQIFELLCAVINNKTQVKTADPDGIATVADVSFDPEPANKFKSKTVVKDTEAPKVKSENATVASVQKPVAKKRTVKVVPVKKKVVKAKVVKKTKPAQKKVVKKTSSKKIVKSKIKSKVKPAKKAVKKIVKAVKKAAVKKKKK